jgi:hypothetical protein
MELKNIRTERFDIGRAVIGRYAPAGGGGLTSDGAWDGTGPLFAQGAMVHDGTTEGELMIEANEEFSDLTIELTGPAILKRYLNGESPSFEVGVFPTPEGMKVFSPTGTASMGSMRRRLVRVHTLWIAPEQLFLKTNASGIQGQVEVYFDGTDWLKDGDALTAEEAELLDLSVVMWKAQYGRVLPRYSHDDGGKSLRTVTVNALQDLGAPDGAQLLLAMSEAEDFEVDFTGSES